MQNKAALYPMRICQSNIPHTINCLTSYQVRKITQIDGKTALKLKLKINPYPCSARNLNEQLEKVKPLPIIGGCKGSLTLERLEKPPTDLQDSKWAWRPFHTSWISVRLKNALKTHSAHCFQWALLTLCNCAAVSSKEKHHNGFYQKCTWTHLNTPKTHHQS